MQSLKDWLWGPLDYVKIQPRLVAIWLWTSADYFLIHGKWGGPFSVQQGLRAGTKWHHCWQAQQEARDRVVIARLHLCARVRKHWYTIVRRLVVLHMWPPNERYQGTSALVWTACPVHELKPTHYVGEHMHFFFLSLVWLHFRECLVPQVPLKKYHVDYNFGRDCHFYGCDFCYNSPIVESTFIGCLLEIIDPGLHINCIKFACHSFTVSHTCLFTL